ncbi:MAG: hypothetical protein LBF89_02435 [Bacteroidales bacterium]|jgi:hypothetical protein|nr:hypothetical protein [Bacteroidales bacterium]
MSIYTGKYLRISLTAGLFLLCVANSAYAQSSRESVIFKAMHDELKRNRDSLRIDGREEPFFIQYAVQRGAIFQALATLGALTGVNEFPLGAMSVQTLVGSYRMANINHTSSDYRAGSAGDASPIDDNYREIRRRLWLLTDQAYKGAIEGYSNKTAAVKRQNLPEDVLAMSDFTPLTPAIYTESLPSMAFEQEYWKKTARDCSAVLKKYPSIYGSSVGIEVYSGEIYSVNSEGTQLKHSVRMIAVAVNAYTKSSDGEEISDRLAWYGRSKADLPSAEQLTETIGRMAESLIALSKAPLMEESYTGPVLLEDNVLASALVESLLAPQTGLIAYRTPIASGGVQKSMEDRIHRKVLSSDITVRSIPQTDSYNGHPLTGSYRADAEGIKPAELLLVENGMLKTLMCDRVPKKKIKVPTGNRIYTYQPTGISTIVSPGVLSVQTSKGLSPDTLKKKLLAVAKDEGLDYAYILRSLPNGRNVMLCKVQVADGNESLVRSGIVSGIGMNRLKRSLGTSGQTQTVNMIVGNAPLSVIYPSAMLIEELDIEKKNLQNTSKMPPVSNPLK